MQIIHTVTELRNVLQNQTSIAFVPTMGNLHAGHIHLVQIAKQHAECVVVSIFVNPLQFGVNEDLASYPRTLEADCEKLKAAGAAIVFAPSVNEMYADFDGINLNQTMTINPPAIADTLCGASRPEHFAGVATVVMKLFNIVTPNVAVFGKKDFQQLFMIRELVKQFNLPITIIASETIREDSGLAMSSRNGYLTQTQKIEAAELHRLLQTIVDKLRSNHQAGKINELSDHYKVLENEAIQVLMDHGWQVDYVSIRNADTLQPAEIHDAHLVALAAAKIGSTRLIDNIEFILN
ncbi:MAG TPA: pantoate--beta-alanine ligase [Methylotenera sp.]|nr:pantoate--beta-alanine ligase [Methylotenera sp.]